MQNIPTIIANWGLCFAASFCLLAGAAEAQTQTFTDPQFVTANYFAVLGRTPDWTGWAYWYGLLDAAPGHQSIGRPAVSSGLISSSEYYGKCQSRLPGTTVYSYGVDANGKAEALTNSGNYGWKPDPNGLPPSCPENSSYTIGWFPHNDDFVTLLYLEAVNREPDTAGWIYYYCSLVSTQACSSLLGWPPGYAASTEGETVDNFIAAGTEFVTDWGESYTVIPTSAIANPTSLGNNIWQTVTVAYSSSGGVSAIASGTVFVGTGDPTTYGSSLNGCEILWASSGQAATLYEIYNNGTPTKWSGTMQTGGTIGGSSVCSLDLRNSGYNPVTGTLTLTLLYLNTMSGQQTVWSYGADAQGWPTLPGVSLAVFTVGAPSITSVSPPNPSIGTPTTGQAPIPYHPRRLIRGHLDLIAVELNVQRVVVDIGDEIHVQPKLVLPHPLPHRPGRHMKWTARADPVHAVQANRETQRLPIIGQVHPRLAVLRKRQRKAVDARRIDRKLVDRPRDRSRHRR